MTIFEGIGENHQTYSTALPLFASAISRIESLKESQNSSSISDKKMRKRQQPQHLDEFKIDRTLGDRDEPKVDIGIAFNSIIEKVLIEKDKRFTENSDIL